jgi:DNA modification methylase
MTSDRDPSSPQKRRANELDGKTWTRYSISVWSDLRKSPEELALGHPALFPVSLASRLISIFTNGQDRVILDPFAGVGSTIVAAKQLGKEGVGVEISPLFAEKARLRCQQENLFRSGQGKAEIHTANAIDLLNYLDPESVDLVITSPPYWDVLNAKRTADYKQTRNYGDSQEDLGNIKAYPEFLAALKAVFEQVHLAMRPRAYCCVIVMDLRKKDKFYPFHSDIATLMQDIGFIYDDLIIWDRRHEYNSMRPLGYPAVFRINKAHEYIVIFQKARSIASSMENKSAEETVKDLDKNISVDLARAKNNIL